MNGKPTQPGPFDLKAYNGGVVGNVVIFDNGAQIFLQSNGPYGREDLRSIGHRLMEIADFNSGLRE